MIDIQLKNNEKYKTFLDDNSDEKNMIENYNDINKSHSPSKFIENNDKNNITNSMIKINNEKYIEMLNNLLNKGNDGDNKKNQTKNIEKNKIYNKFKTNTKNNILFKENINNKNNNLKTSTELEAKNNYNDNNFNTNIYNGLLSDKENYHKINFLSEK